MAVKHIPTKLVDLSEATYSGSTPLQVNSEKCVVQGVKVLGRISRNGREYTDNALAQVTRLVEGVRVNVDHVNPGDRRSYRDRLGVLKSATLREDGIYADLHYNPKHDLIEQVLWDAANAPANLGLSIDAKGQERLVKGKRLVESVDRVKSVDLVADPASVAGLFESENPSQEESPMALTELTLAQLRAERPDLITSLVESLTESEEAKKREADLKTLQEELQTLKSEKAQTLLKEKVMVSLQEAKLDPTNTKHVSPAFLTTLLEAKDDATRKALIEDRKTLVESLAPPPGSFPSTGMGRYTPQANQGSVGATVKDRVRSWSSGY